MKLNININMTTKNTCKCDQGGLALPDRVTLPDKAKLTLKDVQGRKLGWDGQPSDRTYICCGTHVIKTGRASSAREHCHPVLIECRFTAPSINK